MKIANSSALKNAFWSVFEAAVYPIMLLISTPFFIDKLGIETYGLWMLVNSSLAFLDILGFGVNETLIKYISEYRSTNTIDLIQSLIGLLYPVVWFSVILGSSIGVIVSFGGWESLLSSDNARNYDQFKMLIPIAYFGLTLKMLEQFFVSIFKGFEMYHISSRLTLSTKLLVLIVQGILVFNGFGLFEMFAAIVAVLFGMLLLEFLLVKRFFPFISFRFNFKKSAFIKLAPFSFWSYLQVVVATLSNQLDKFIIAFFIGLEFLAYYSIGFMVFRQLNQLLIAASSWIFPRVSALKSKILEIKSVFRFSNYILTFLVFLGCFFLFLIKDFAFTLWLGEELYSQSNLYLSRFIELLAIVSFTIVPGFVLMGSGYVKTHALLDVFYKVLNIAGVVIGYYFNGIAGLLFGLLVSAFLYLPIQYFYLNKKVGIDYNTKLLFTYFVSICSFLIFVESESVAIKLLGVFMCAVSFFAQIKLSWSSQEYQHVRKIMDRN